MNVRRPVKEPLMLLDLNPGQAFTLIDHPHISKGMVLFLIQQAGTLVKSQDGFRTVIELGRGIPMSLRTDVEVEIVEGEFVPAHLLKKESE